MSPAPVCLDNVRYHGWPPGERGTSVLADLLNATDDAGAQLSDPEVRDALITMLIAGHDTTAIALAWALEQITC